MNALIASTAQRIESGNINATANLNAGDIGPAEIRDNTTLQADIAIANNQIQNGTNKSYS